MLPYILDEIDAIKKQIKSINREIKERKKLSQEIITRLQERISRYKEIENDKIMLDTYSFGNNFDEMREHIRNLIRQLEQEIKFEKIKAWNDIQALLKEKRHLERELKSLYKREKFLQEFLREFQ